MERIIKKMPATAPMRFQKKRVAAYARVSSGKDAMLHSLSAQVSYYSEYIQKQNNWQYVGVYADEALSGTKDDRIEFQRLLSDCRSGLIDMIITKSISRFARNTVTMLEVIRELKQLNVDVFFEKENIHSIGGDGELMLTILASFAQAESQSVSENVKWRIRKQFQSGEVANWRFMYGYRNINGEMVIGPDEAGIVRSVFHDYINGMNVVEIAQRLQEEGIATMFGGKWSAKRINDMLRNEKYAGNSLLQKKYVTDYLTKARSWNSGQLPMYYATETHTPIIDPETFEQAQAIYESNKKKFEPKGPTTNRYPFSSMIFCSNCGRKYKRKVTQSGVVWNCATFLNEGRSACHTKQIPEEILLSVAAEVLGLAQFDETVFKRAIKQLFVPSFNVLMFDFHDGRQTERKWQDRSRSESWDEAARKRASEQMIKIRRKA